MARARNIKPGLYKNEELAECSIWARYLFPGLWMLADRRGILEDRPKRIKGELYPYDPKVDVEKCIDELERHGFVSRYTAGGYKCIQINKFEKHQHPHQKEAASELPGQAPDKHGAGTRQAPDKHRSSPADSLLPKTDGTEPPIKPKPPSGGAVKPKGPTKAQKDQLIAAWKERYSTDQPPAWQSDKATWITLARRMKTHSFDEVMRRWLVCLQENPAPGDPIRGHVLAVFLAAKMFDRWAEGEKIPDGYHEDNLAQYESRVIRSN